MDVKTLSQRWGVCTPRLVAKAAELLRLSTAKLPIGGLGQGEVCRGAVCLDLACQILQVSVDSSIVVRTSGSTEKNYRQTRSVLQRLLNINCSLNARDVCVRFGCLSLEGSVRGTLAAYKGAFVAALPPHKKDCADFGRPVFAAAAFFVVARANKVKVDKKALLEPLGILGPEFAEVCASISALVPAQGTAPSVKVKAARGKRRKENENDENADPEPGTLGSIREATWMSAQNDRVNSDEEEVEDPGMVGHRIDPKRQKTRDYAAWKARVLGECNRPVAPKAKLVQTPLSFR